MVDGKYEIREGDCIIMNRKIKLGIIFLLGIIVVFVIIGCKNTSRFRLLEKHNITYISHSYKSKDLYFVSEDSDVYILKNKELQRVDKLSGLGIKKIISTKFETILLDTEGKLYEVDESSYDLSPIDINGKCKDICNGIVFYSVLKEDGNVMVSWDIGKEGNIYKGTDMFNIDMPIEAIQIEPYTAPFWNSDSRDKIEAYEMAVSMLDIDGNVWVYGNTSCIIRQKNYTEHGLNKISDLTNVKKIAGGFSLTFMDEGGGYYYMSAWIDDDTVGEDYNFLSKDIMKSIYIDSCVNIAMGNEKGAALSKEGILYTYYGVGIGRFDYKLLRKNRNIFPSAKLYVCRLGVIAIYDDGTVMWCRDAGFLNEGWRGDKKTTKLIEIVPIENFI